MIKRSLAASDGTTVYYEISENKGTEHILLLHGLGGDLRAWDPIQKRLEKLDYKTIALDLRGQGLSGRPKDAKAYTLSRFSSDIDEILQLEKIKNVIVVGHCFGGMVAINYVDAYPKQVKRLLLIDSNYKSPPMTKIVTKYKLGEKLFSFGVKFLPGFHLPGSVDYSQFIHTTDYDKKRIFSDITHTSLKSYMLIVENLLHFNAEKMLERIRIPTVIIEGTEDSIFPPAVAREIHKRIKNSELVFIEGANHIGVITHPDDVVKSMVQFLKKKS